MFAPKFFAVFIIWLLTNVVAKPQNNWFPLPIAVPGGNGGAAQQNPTPTLNPSQTQNPTAEPTLSPNAPTCGDPDMGCVFGISAAMCDANNVCDTSVEGALVQCYVNECVGSENVPRCSCRNPDTDMVPPPPPVQPDSAENPTQEPNSTPTPNPPSPPSPSQIVRECNDPDNGCVTGKSAASCNANNVCDTSDENALVQCYLNECSNPGPIPRCSCRNPSAQSKLVNFVTL